MTSTIDTSTQYRWEQAIIFVYLSAITSSFLLYAPALVSRRGPLHSSWVKPTRLTAIASKALLLAADWQRGGLAYATQAGSLALCWIAGLLIAFPQSSAVFQSQTSLYVGIVLELLFDALAAPQFTMFFSTPTLPRLVLLSMAFNFGVLVRPPPELRTVSQSKDWSFSWVVKDFRRTTSVITRDALSPNPVAADPTQHQPEDDFAAVIEADLLTLQAKRATASNPRSLETALLSLLLEKPTAILFISFLFVALCLLQALFLFNTLTLFSLNLPVFTTVHLHFILAAATIYMKIAIARAKIGMFTTAAAQKAKTILSAAIFHKAMRLNRQVASDSVAQSLLSDDIEGIMANIPLACWGMLSLMESIFILIALIYIVGTLPSLILAVGIARYFYKLAETFRKRENQEIVSNKIQDLFAATKDMISSLVPLKMMGLEDTYFMRIQRLKIAELEAWTGIRVIQMHQAIETLLFLASTTLVLLATMIWKLKFEGSSIMTTAPVAAILFYRIGITLKFVPHIRLISRIQNSLQQIEDFLLLEERTEVRQFKAAKQDTTSEPIAVKITGLTCFLNDDAEPPFQKLDLSLENGTVSVLRGPSASGKTALLQSILGEVKLAEGSIGVFHGPVAYCGQTTWLQSTSIKENITGSSEVDGAWYARVVDACDLRVEFNKFPESDSTVICTNDVSLSLGQKMKITLARAIYTKAPIILLDDAFSVFDNAMASDLALRLFSAKEGLLRQQGTTVILAAQTFPVPTLVDSVYDIKSSGASKVSQQSLELTTSSSMSSLQAGIAAEPRQQQRLPIATGIPTGYNKLSTMQLLRFMLDKFLLKKTFYKWACLFTFITALEWCIDATIWTDAHLSNHSVHYSLIWLMMAILTVVAGVYELNIFRLSLVPEFVQSVHDKMLQSALWSSIACSPNNSAEVETVMTDDLFAATRKLPTHIAMILYDGTMLAIYFGIVISVTEYSVYSGVAAAVVVYFIQKAFITASKAADKLSASTSMKLKSKFSDVINGLTYIHNLKWNDQIWDQLLMDLKATQMADIEKLRLDPWLSMAIDLTALGIMLSLAVSFTIYRDSVSMYTIGLSILTLCKFQETAIDIMQYFLGLATMKESLARMEYFHSNFEEESVRDELVLPNRWGEDQPIEFNQAVIGNHAPITGVALPGHPVTIRGRSGSGKSRILMAILSLVPYRGSIKIAGREVRKIPPRELRKHISTITQEPFDLPGTVGDNLFLYKLRNPEITGPVFHVVTDHLLDRLDIRNALAGPYDASFSQLHLSYGQRQGVNIARSALHKLQTSNPILLMDDVCGRLDEETALMYKEVAGECFFGTVSIVVETADSDLEVIGLQPLPVRLGP